jgi:cell division septation protein DedD
MAPILIDNRGLIKLGFIMSLATGLVFTGGFVTGYQRAITFYQADSNIESLSLPANIVAAQSDIEPQIPETIAVGEEIDVDQPEVLTQAITQPATQATNLAVNAQTVDLLLSEKILISKETVNDVNLKIDSNQGSDTHGPKNSANQTTSFATNKLSKIKYSIQAGVYGRLVNAEKMMRMLQAQHLDAYVSDYTNRKNEVHYNVRFGYFADKKTAIAALDEYINIQKGEGYLVNFSVKDIADLAGSEDAKQLKTVEETDKNLSSITPQPPVFQDKISQDKVSQENISSISSSLTKAQVKTITN